MEHPHYSFTRIFGFVFYRALQAPKDIAWYVPREGRVEAISYQLLGACLFALSQKFDALGIFNSHSVVVTKVPNSLCFALIDFYCSMKSLVHASIDLRLTIEVQSELETKADSDLPTLNAAQLHRWFCDSAFDASCCNKSSWIDPVEEARSASIRIIEDCDVALIELGRRTLSDQPSAVEEFLRIHVDRCNQAIDGSDKATSSIDDAAILLHTSGSSGPPKFVTLSHRNLISNAMGKLFAMPQLPTDRRINLLPFAHAYARTCELYTWAIAGGSITCVHNMHQAESVSPLIRPTLFNGVPLVFDQIVKNLSLENRFHPEQIVGGNLRMVASGGAGLDDATFDAFLKIGLPIHQGYGLTETSPVVCSNRWGEVTCNSIGPAIEHVQLRVDSNQQLWVRGPNLMLGYWKDPTSTAQRIQDGWLATGDLAEQLTNGHWRILGRRDDQIALSNGYKLNPSNIEVELRKSCPGLDLVIALVEQQLVAMLATCKTNADSISQVECFQTALLRLSKPIRARYLLLASEEAIRRNALKNQKGQWLRAKVAMYLAEQKQHWIAVA